MKVKIIGFKVGAPRPTYNRTLDLDTLLQWGHVRDPRNSYNRTLDLDTPPLEERQHLIGFHVTVALGRSDFLSIRRID